MRGIAAATKDMVTISPTEPTSATYGAPVTVTVPIPYSSVTWLPSTWFISGKHQLDGQHGYAARNRPLRAFPCDPNLSLSCCWPLAAAWWRRSASLR